MATKKTLKQQEEGESSNMPVQEKEATAKQGFPDQPAALLCDHGMEEYHLVPLPAADRIHTLKNKAVSWLDGLIIGFVEGGWLIHYRSLCRRDVYISGYRNEFLCYNYVSFRNPFSGAKVELPPQPCFVTREDFKPQFVADVIPSNCSPDSPEFFAVAFFLNSNRYWLAFCKIGDESWTRIADIVNTRDVSGPIHLTLALDDKNKLLYFVHLNSSFSGYDLMVFHLKDSEKIKTKRIVMAEYNTPIQSCGIIDGVWFAYRTAFLVVDSSCGDLFLVFQENNIAILPGGTISNVLPVKGYGVYKLEEDVPRWKEIHELGDRSIIVSYWGSRVISTAEGSKSEEESIKGNCIYFALQSARQINDSLRRDIGVFSLTDASINHFPLDSLFQKNPLGTLWVIPNSS